MNLHSFQPACAALAVVTLFGCASVATDRDTATRDAARQAGAAGHAAHAETNAAAATASERRLERIKQLAGDWVEAGEDGRPTDQVVSSFRLTAGGSAVLEKLFEGTDHEMATLYHVDGSDLVLTHYCVEGNQPHMRATADSGPDAIVFRCVGGTNMVSEDDRHMHQGTIRFLGEDRIRTEWKLLDGGEHVYTADFELVRRRP